MGIFSNDKPKKISTETNNQIEIFKEKFVETNLKQKNIFIVDSEILYKNILSTENIVFYSNKDIKYLVDEITDTDKKYNVNLTYFLICIDKKNIKIAKEILENKDLKFVEAWQLKNDCSYCVDNKLSQEQLNDFKNKIDLFIKIKTKINISINGVTEISCGYILSSPTKQNPDRTKMLTNFIIEPEQELILNNEKILKTKIITEDNEISKNFNLSDFTSVLKFKTALNDMSLSYWGKDEELESIKYIISKKKYPKRQATHTIGLHKIENEWVYVGNTKTINSNNIEFKDLTYINNGGGIVSNIENIEPITKDELKNIINDLFKYNTLNKTMSILSFVNICFLKERFKALKIKVPHLLIEGEAGSGKSETLEYVIKKLFSTDIHCGADAITKFTLLKKSSSTNAVPLLLDEYKPSYMKNYQLKLISEYLRSSFDDSTGYRGRSDQTVQEYMQTSPTIIAGEEGFSETALNERCIELIFSKKDLKYKKDYFRNIKNKSNELNKLGRLFLNRALTISDEKIMDLLKIAKQDVEKNIGNIKISDRKLNSIEVLITSCLIIIDIFSKIGVSIPYKYESILKTLIYDIKNDDTNNKSAVDVTIEIFDRMLDAEKIFPNNYQFVNENKELELELALDIKSIYDVFLKYIREHNLQDNYITSQKDFCKQLAKTNYFVGYKTVHIKENVYNNFKGKKVNSKKMYSLNVKKMKEKNIDIENFLNFKWI